MVRVQSRQFQLETVLQFFEKDFGFREILLQSQSTENIQNFQWLLHKNLPISQIVGCIKNL